MNKTASLIVAAGLVVGIGIIFVGMPRAGSGGADRPVGSVEVRDGVQYVTIHARGGYSPRESKAKAGIPTKLVVTTDGTYDCSASLVVRSVGYQGFLSPSGAETIDLGTPEAGTLRGACSMGMYGFSIDFE